MAKEKMNTRALFTAIIAAAASALPASLAAADAIMGSGPGVDSAPAKDGVVAVMTDIQAGTPFAPMLTAALKAFKPKAVLRFERSEAWRLKDEIAALKPSDIVVVCAPETIDLPFHIEMLKICLTVDADPFPDFRFGYLTAALPAEGDAFVRAIARAAALKTRFPATVTESGASIKSRFDPERPAMTCPGLKVQRLLNSGPEFLYQNKSCFENRGFIHLFGESSPWGMDDGVNSQFLRETRVRLSPAIVVSGGKLLATVDYHYPEGSAGRNQRIGPGDSFALAAISREPSGLILSFGRGNPDAARREIERMTLTGMCAGDAAMESWIEGLMSGPEGDFAEAAKAQLLLKPQDHDEWFGLVSRAFFGNPSAAQLAKPLAKPHLVAKASGSGEGLEIECSFTGAEMLDSSVFQRDGKDVDCAAFRVPINAADADQELLLRAIEVRSGDRFPNVAFSRVAIERWADVASCRVFLLLDSMGGARTFRTGETLKIRISLEKRK